MFRFGVWFPSAVCLALIALTACQPRHYARIDKDTITLYFTRPDARQVLFSSSTDRFRIHSAINRDGVWEFSVPYQAEFAYFYLVDGQVVLPDCRLRVSDDFGSQNCLFAPGL